MKKIMILLLAVLMLCLWGCAQELISDNVIDTEYFTLTLPASWDGAAVCEVVPDGDRYAIECWERQDYETSGTGKLCTIKLYAQGEDFTIPGHMLYGILETPEADYRLVVLYPTDVQFTEDTADRYNAMFEQIPDVMETLTPKKGCEYLRPQLEGMG